MNGQDTYHTIGKSYSRVDAWEKVTGLAKYADDLVMPGMLVARCIHSTHPHAKVHFGNIEFVRNMTGVACVLTMEDFPKPQSMLDFFYCTDTPKFIGDVVAVIAAENTDVLEDAVHTVRLSYEDLPAVYTIEDSLRLDAPVIRDIGVGLEQGIPKKGTAGNVFLASHRPLRKGNVEKALRDSDVTLTRTYETQFAEHAYIEPESVLVYRDVMNGIITARSCSQHGHIPRDFIADVLQIPLNRAKSIQCTVGGSFGGKFEIVGLMCGRAAMVLDKTGRPCKMTLSREDSILESAKRHPFRTTVTIGASKDGKILAYKSSQVENCGAYNNQAPWMNIRAMVHSAGPYDIESVWTDTFGVYTNNPTPCAFRGYSSPQVIFCNEMIIDELADTLHMSVVDLKRKNLLRQGGHTATGQQLIHETLLVQMMDDIVRDTDYEAKVTRYRTQHGRWRKGIGLVTSYRGVALGGESVDSSGAMLTALEDGSFILNVALMEVGQGLQTVYVQIAAEATGVHMDDIVIEAVNSNHIPDSGLTVASRGTAQGGQSVRKAGVKMKALLLESARILLEATQSETVELEDSICFIKERPSCRIPVAQVCRYRKLQGLSLATFEWYVPRPLVNDGVTGQGEAFTTYAYGTSVAEVQVNVETGEVQVERITAYHDVGKAINPSLIKGQIYGGILMGMGFGLWEEVHMDKGRTDDINYDSYKIATSLDMPRMDIKLYECKDSEGTYGAKCIAEAATEMIGAVLALAVKHAVGHPIRRLPVSLERIVTGEPGC
jgi:CO/xanthine dehydrogenase Mo-binding subunit